MNDYAIRLLSKHRGTGLLIDTNILLMLLIGSYNRHMIEQFKRTKQYTIEDYDLAIAVIRRVNNVITLPSILAEVSNLAGQLGGKRSLFECFSAFANWIQQLEEQQIASVDVAQTDEFLRFGLTDASILQVARTGYLVLTDDFRLSNYMESNKLDVLNFTHLRAPNLER